jgi:hypothetical protein
MVALIKAQNEATPDTRKDDTPVLTNKRDIMNSMAKKFTKVGGKRV